MPCRHYTPLSVCLSRFHSYSNDIGRFFFIVFWRHTVKLSVLCTLFWLLVELLHIARRILLAKWYNCTHAPHSAQRNTQHVIKSMFQFIVAYTIWVSQSTISLILPIHMTFNSYIHTQCVLRTHRDPRPFIIGLAKCTLNSTQSNNIDRLMGQMNYWQSTRIEVEQNDRDKEPLAKK